MAEVRRPKRQEIPTKLRFELWGMACVICGDCGDIEIDHIVPVAKGGGSERSNLQPLASNVIRGRAIAARGQTMTCGRCIWLAKKCTTCGISTAWQLATRTRMTARHLSNGGPPNA